MHAEAQPRRRVLAAPRAAGEHAEGQEEADAPAYAVTTWSRRVLSAQHRYQRAHFDAARSADVETDNYDNRVPLITTIGTDNHDDRVPLITTIGTDNHDNRYR